MFPPWCGMLELQSGAGGERMVLADKTGGAPGHGTRSARCVWRGPWRVVWRAVESQSCMKFNFISMDCLVYRCVRFLDARVGHGEAAVPMLSVL